MMITWIILFSGDVELNPGPTNWKYPCGSCSQPRQLLFSAMNERYFITHRNTVPQKIGADGLKVMGESQKYQGET